MKFILKICIFSLILSSFLSCGRKEEINTFYAKDERDYRDQSGKDELADEDTTHPPPSEPKSKEMYSAIIEALGGNHINLEDYETTVKGYNKYLKDIHDQLDPETIGSSFTPSAHNIKHATACGLPKDNSLFPDKSQWQKGAIFMLIYNLIEKETNLPPVVTSWWRPSCYNKKIGGAKRSDHINGDAVDIFFPSIPDRIISQRIICEKIWNRDEFNIIPLQSPESSLVNIAIGFDTDMLHVSLFSNKGRRYWLYDADASTSPCDLALLL